MKSTFLLKTLSFNSTRQYARPLNLKSKKEWGEWCKSNITKKPRTLPTLPNLVYKNNGWISYKDWLGH